MKKLTTALSLAVIVGIAAVGTVTAPGTAQAYACKAQATTGSGFRKNKMMARLASRRNWTGNTKSRYGLAWSVYKIAKSKSTNCTYGHKSKKWRCQTAARPCKYVVQ